MVHEDERRECIYNDRVVAAASESQPPRYRLVDLGSGYGCSYFGTDDPFFVDPVQCSCYKCVNFSLGSALLVIYTVISESLPSSNLLPRVVPTVRSAFPLALFIFVRVLPLLVAVAVARRTIRTWPLRWRFSVRWQQQQHRRLGRRSLLIVYLCREIHREVELTEIRSFVRYGREGLAWFIVCPRLGVGSRLIDDKYF